MERYELSLYFDEDVDRELGNPIAIFESDIPFGAIVERQLIDPMSWDKSYSDSPVLFRVLGVEHAFERAGNITKHGIRVFVTPVDKSEHTRLNLL